MKTICRAVLMALLALSVQPLARAETNGVVVGTLTIGGEVTKLRHVFAQRREARPADATRFELKDGEGLRAGVIDLIATNEPLSDAAMADLIEQRYQGSRIRGVWLLLDPSNAHSLRSFFLLATGALPSAMGTAMSSSEGSAQVEHGKLTGKLAGRIQEVSTLKTYEVLFDTPLEARPFEVDPNRQTLATEAMPGSWTIERWWAENGSATQGTLVIDEGGTTGTFRFLLADGQVFEEAVTITRQGTQLRLEGRVPEGARWNPDTLDLDLRGDLLIGKNQDTGGVTASVVLRKTA